MATVVEAAYHREYFYVGGTYVPDPADTIGSGYILRNKVYVECLTPVGGARRPHPLIFVHGGGQSGTVSAIYRLFINSSRPNRPGYVFHGAYGGYEREG